MNMQENALYQKHVLLDEIGKIGQQKLLAARVLVVGMGGLGCPAAQYLAASGIGSLIFLDGDLVSPSNLHRQILYGIQDVGKSKSKLAESHFKTFYPHLNFEGITEFLTPSNALQLIENCDVVVDCTDNFKARYVINDACVKLEKPFVYGAIHKFQGQVAVFNYQNNATYRCLFPESNLANQVNCSETGVLGVLPGIVGSMQATEAIKLLVELPGLLHTQMITYDALKQQIVSVKLPKRNEDEVNRIRNAAFHPSASENKPLVHEISWERAFDDKTNCIFIDGREDRSKPNPMANQSVAFDWNKMESSLSNIPLNQPLAVYCQRGIRSREAARKLLKIGYTQVFSISGGLESYVANTVELK